MSSIIDTAYEKQMSLVRGEAVAQIIRLEKEIRDAEKGMKETWTKLYEKYDYNPSELMTLGAMEIKDDDLETSQSCLTYTRTFAEKLNEYKQLCRLNGITPNPSIVKKEKEVQSTDEYSSNDRKSNVASTATGQRSPGHRDNRGLSRRRSKKHRRY